MPLAGEMGPTGPGKIGDQCRRGSLQWIGSRWRGYVRSGCMAGGEVLGGLCAGICDRMDDG